MIDISIRKGIKSFGFKNVLDELDLEVINGEKIGLIGLNGSGKSTILKIISGDENLNSGMLSIRKDASIGMLPQIPAKVDNDITVKDMLNNVFVNLYNLEKKIRLTEEKMASCNDKKNLEKTMKLYGKMQEEYYNSGGYEIESRINKISNGFKLKKFLSTNYNDLSGGEKTIVNLAILVLKNPSILLLDEPTNHLDIDTLEWFEDYIKNYNGTVIIVSHDRYFLDRVVTKIVLLEKGKGEIFHGNYSYYIAENERRILSEFENYKNQQKLIEAMKNKIKKLQEFGRLASPGGESFFKRAASIQKRLDKISKLDKPEEKKELPLDFKINERSGNDVIVAKDINLTIGNKILIKKGNLKVIVKEKVCLMGKNGAGKSTLIKCIINSNSGVLTNGAIKTGSNVSIGYIPQEINFEDGKESVLEIARKSFSGTETYLRASLAKFLFYGENVYKRVESLSGGEKVRLKLFELIQKQANLLILDEPTNHIDIDTREMLEEALLEYNGTIFFVSHDRYFINRLATRIINIEDQMLVSYLGNYDYYKDHISGVIKK
jgi:ATPase subunit of ABC transporter with duplicated ATPase domains